MTPNPYIMLHPGGAGNPRGRMRDKGLLEAYSPRIS
jgi:hypothetical protein